jgi:phage baseplate assembly protein W
MANGKTYGLAFPFNPSVYGDYVMLTETANDEIRTDLIHLLLTRKGSRYFLPDFGTRLYEYIFEPLDTPTFDSIESEIRDSCEKYLPQLKITNISVKALTSEESGIYATTEGNVVDRQFSMPGVNPAEYTAKVKIDYVITDDVFGTKDFVILNI